MKMVLVRLKVLILKLYITVFVLITVLMQMKYERTGIVFIRQNMALLVAVERLHKGHHQTTLHHSEGFKRKSIGKVSRSPQTYVYLVFTSQVQERSGIVDNSASAADAQ